MKDIKQEITSRIIELIEEHGTNWTKPFSELGGVPTNVSTGKRYRGMNAFWLGLLGKSEVATYRQWAALDCQVRKGSKGTPVSVPMIVKDRETGENKGLFFKSATVFSADQVEGWTSPEVPTVDLTERLSAVDDFVTATGAAVRHGSQRGCYYVPSEDYIHMLLREQFKPTETSSATEAYYSTLLHELTHWSGHKSRCDRFAKKQENGYAFEELVAEIGAAILCATLNVSTEVRADHAQYIANWLQAFKGDKNYIFSAAAEAQKAVDYLINQQVEMEAAA